MGQSSQEIDPGELEKVPGAQLVQVFMRNPATSCSMPYFPAGQFKHTEAPVSENCPKVEHGRHSNPECPSRYLPAAHRIQVVAAGFKEYEPAAHGEQTAVPGVCANFPISQLEQNDF